MDTQLDEGNPGVKLPSGGSKRLLQFLCSDVTVLKLGHMVTAASQPVN